MISQAKETMMLERALDIQLARKNGIGKEKQMIVIHPIDASSSISQSFLLLPFKEHEHVWVINAFPL